MSRNLSSDSEDRITGAATAAALAAAWRNRPRLGRAEAEAFASDVAQARRRVEAPHPPDWEREPEE